MNNNLLKNLLVISAIMVLVSCNSKEARYPIVNRSGVDYSMSIELAKKIKQKEEKHFREYMQENKLEFERSNFGFLYKIENNLDSLIRTGDKVKYNYRVENLNGIILYPKKSRELVVDHQEEIKGMHEGLKLMSEGSEGVFLFPSYQAYGYHGDEKKIKPNTPLVYRVEILAVERKINEKSDN